jgi:arsenite methyltransferase
MSSVEQQDEVATYYRDKAASALSGTSCCEPEDAAFGAVAYRDLDLGPAPEAALLASMGCGNPLAVAELRPGETVLDLGSGAGLDLILSANRVGRDGLVYGLDFIEEMLAAARANIADADIDNVVLLKGRIEQIPLPANSVDVVISNCVINLAADKAAVFGEIHRVLAPGGRIGISDVVAEDHLTADERAERGSRAQCIAGALSVSEYEDLLAAAGLCDISVAFTELAADSMHTAIIRATKPATADCC